MACNGPSNRLERLDVAGSSAVRRRRVLPATSCGGNFVNSCLAWAADRTFYARPGISSSNSACSWETFRACSSPSWRRPSWAGRRPIVTAVSPTSAQLVFALLRYSRCNGCDDANGEPDDHTDGTDLHTASCGVEEDPIGGVILPPMHALVTSSQQTYWVATVVCWRRHLRLLFGRRPLTPAERQPKPGSAWSRASECPVGGVGESGVRR